jgi:hypothetical protein
MGNLLINNPSVLFYLLYAGALTIALICAQLRNPPPSNDGSPAKRSAKRERKEDL